MGTRFELALHRAGAALPPAALRAAGEAALDEIETWHRRLSRFAPDSFVSHLNRTAAVRPVRLDADLVALFEDALTVWRASDGAFDVAGGADMARRGFAGSAVASGAPSAHSGLIALDRAAGTIAFRSAGVSIDLGGIAKGHALDRAAATLREAGVRSALLHGGTSSVIAIGRPAGAGGWRVALGPEPGAPVVVLADRALAISDASSQRSAAGASHIRDPRSALAAADSRRAIVFGPSARLADAWATALVVLGRVPAEFPPGYEARLAAPRRAIA